MPPFPTLSSREWVSMWGAWLDTATSREPSIMGSEPHTYQTTNLPDTRNSQTWFLDNG